MATLQSIKGFYLLTSTKAAVVAIVALLALSFTLFQAVPAEAHYNYRGAPLWKCTAHYESTHRWKANTGNGYYGGLQHKQSTWFSFGGSRYAWRADYATRWEQVQIARNVAFRGNWKYQRTNGKEGHRPQGLSAFSGARYCR